MPSAQINVRNVPLAELERVHIVTIYLTAAWQLRCSFRRQHLICTCGLSLRLVIERPAHLG